MHCVTSIFLMWDLFFVFDLFGNDLAHSKCLIAVRKWILFQPFIFTLVKELDDHILLENDLFYETNPSWQFI